jgi:homoserine/homoserine lactone efflux protein
LPREVQTLTSRAMSLHAWTLFLAVALTATLSPGPTMLAILGHALARGGAETMAVVLGNAAGAVLMMAGSVFGLAAVIAAIPHGLATLKWAGALYLLWLGLRAWWAAAPKSRAVPTGTPRRRGGFIRGLLIALGNPKAILLFGAVLPQFVDGGRPLAPQFAVLVVTFVGLELLVTTAVAFGAGRLEPMLRGADGRRVADRIGGSVLILAALAVAATSLSEVTS